MTEKKRENRPKENRKVSGDLNGSEDDLESLSSEEKAAFDKIMAEIASATGTDPVAPSIEKSLEKTQPASAQMEDQNSKPLETHSPTEKNGSESADENDLNEEQQAALDKIMSEISALNDSDQSGETETVQKAPQNEIDGDRSPEEDQEAALNKIMAEIEARNENDKAVGSNGSDPEPEVSQRENDLSEDQEAALNKIMAEIEARNENDKAVGSNGSDPEPEVTQREDDLSEDQEAALNKIMAEIEARKDGAQLDHSDKSAPSKNMDLSLDEFNQELTQLLSGGNSSDGEEETPPSLVREDMGKEASVNVDNEKGANDVLKEILGDEKPHEEPQAVPANDPSDASLHEAGSEPPPSLKDGYPILKEITAQEESPAPGSEAEKAGKQNTKKASGLTRRLRQCLATVSIASVAAVLALAGYWGYLNYGDQLRSRWFAKKIPGSSQSENLQPAANTPAAAAPNTETQKAPLAAAGVIPEKPKPVPISRAMNLSELVAELDAARRELLAKMDEIQALKSYYQKGIEEEEGKIEARFKGSTLPPYPSAIEDPKIELSLKAVQRRSVYIEKIQLPLDELFSASEKLLFFKRRTQMYDRLIHYVSGFPVLEYQTEVKQIMDGYLENIRGLSADEIDIDTTSLESVWNTMVAHLKAKAASELAYELSNPKDRAISKEICSGDFNRKYLLTVLNPETARCLIKWNGKDLYLNELNHLTPQVAEILSQWPGEWLSLNGLKELSPQTAVQLAKWQGKRLSLNGLHRLSPKATVSLSKWQGAQLELIGLQTMGRWENYGTRLYLSEKLQRQLEGR